MIYGISINLVHSYTNFGLRLLSRKIEIPEKKKVTVDVPFCNKPLDFSRLYNNTQYYEERKLQYEFEFVEPNKTAMQTRIDAIIAWLYTPGVNSGKNIVFDDFMSETGFLAECIDISYEQNGIVCVIKATFTAYPLRAKKDGSGEIV